MSNIVKKWQPKQIKLRAGIVYAYNLMLETANILQIENRKVTGGTTIYADTDNSVDADSYIMKVESGGSQMFIRPYPLRTVYLYADADVYITVIEIESDQINFAYNANQLVDVSGKINGTVTVSGDVEVKNDSGNPLPVSGTVEITNDVGNAIPISGTVTVSQKGGTFPNKSGTLAAANTSQQPVGTNLNRKYLMIQNISAGDLWVDFGFLAVIGQPSIKLKPDEKLVFDNFVPTGSVNIIGATLGQAFVVKEA